MYVEAISLDGDVVGPICVDLVERDDTGVFGGAGGTTGDIASGLELSCVLASSSYCTRGFFFGVAMDP